MSTHWDRIQEIFHGASALEGEALQAFLTEACSGDADLLAQVQSLLSAADDGDSEGHAAGDADASDASPTTPHGHDGAEAPPAAAPPPPSPTTPAPRDPMIGVTVERYTIKRVIGSGGMGIVYEAVQKSPRRTIALKMMKRGVTSKSALRRFEYEAQTLGRLRHEGIAQIHEAGTWDDGTGGRPWFAMEYLPGAKSITQYCDAKKFGTRERLTIFQKICAAVQHGHQKGIIHRDLKPGNILVTSSGVPKIIDFGVARSTDSDLAVTTLQTDVGALIGTLQYMSPEQCDADPHDIDIRSDVYALGVVLYELLCGQPPYDLRRAAIHEAARIIKEEEPTKPSSIDKRLRGNIETITLKALEKDRDRRYQSTLALEEDISRYLEGEPIAAKRPSAWDYMRRFGKRHRATAAAIVATFVVLVVAVVVISIFAAIATKEREEADRRGSRLQETLDRLEVEQFEKRAITEGLGGIAADPFISTLTEFRYGGHPGFEKPDLVEQLRKAIGGRDLTDESLSPDMRYALLYVVGALTDVGEDPSVDSLSAASLSPSERAFLKEVLHAAADWSWLEPLEGNYEITFPSDDGSEAVSNGKLHFVDMGPYTTTDGSLKERVRRIDHIFIRRFSTLGLGLLLHYHSEHAMGFLTRYLEVIDDWPEAQRSDARVRANLIVAIKARDSNTIAKARALLGSQTPAAIDNMKSVLWIAAYERVGDDARALEVLDKSFPDVFPELSQSALDRLSLDEWTMLGLVVANSGGFLGIDQISARERVQAYFTPDLHNEDRCVRAGAAAAMFTFLMSDDLMECARNSGNREERRTLRSALHALDILLLNASLSVDASIPYNIGSLVLGMYQGGDDQGDRLASDAHKVTVPMDPLANIALYQSVYFAKTDRGGWVDEDEAELVMSIGLIRSFEPPTGGMSPKDAVRAALDVANPQQQRAGLAHLGHAEFGGHDIYVRLYRDLLTTAADPLVRCEAMAALARHATPEDAKLIVSRGLRAIEDDPAARWMAFASMQIMPNETLATWQPDEAFQIINQVAADEREFIAIRHEAQAASSFLINRAEDPEKALFAFKNHRYVKHFRPALLNVGERTGMRLHEKSVYKGSIDPLELLTLTTDTLAHELLGVVLWEWFQGDSWRDTMSQDEAADLLSDNIDRLIELELWVAAREPALGLYAFHLDRSLLAHAGHWRSVCQLFSVLLEENWNAEAASYLFNSDVSGRKALEAVADNALSAAQQIAALSDRQDLYGLYFLAVVHAVSGNHAEATSVFREGVALARDHPEALNYWASWCVDAGGDALFPLVADDALGAAVRACELSSHKAPHILDTRARVHFERGELDDAIRWQQEALKYAADDKRAAIAEVLATYQAARDEQPTAASDTTP